MAHKKNSEINKNEYKTFSDALVKVLQVSHLDMQQMLKAEKEKKPTSKRASSSDRVSDEG